MSVGFVQCPVCGFQLGMRGPHDHTDKKQEAPIALSVFQKEGEYWFIGYEADAFRLRDTKGLCYLHMLLGNPGREILALHIVQHGEGSSLPASGHSRLESQEGLRIFMPREADEMIDDTSRLVYEQRVRDLAEEIEDAEKIGDKERAMRSRLEMDFIVEHLAAAIGLAGATRHEPSPAERARQSVTKAIKSAVHRITEHSRALERHLASTIRTGTYCIYQPDPRIPLTWRL